MGNHISCIRSWEGKVIGSLQVMFIGCGGGRSWNKGNMEQCITPLFLDRRDLKLEC